MKRKIYTALLAIIALASCTQSDELSNNNNLLLQDDVIRVTTQVNTVTRVSMTTNDVTQFFLQVAHPTDDNYTYYSMMDRGDGTLPWNSYEAKTGKPDTPLQMLWKNKTDVVTVGGVLKPDHWFSKENFNSSIRYTLYNDQSQEIYCKISDILYMPPTEVDPATNLVDGKILVTLGHLFTKLHLKVTMGTEFNRNNGTETNPITDLKIDGTAVGVWFNAATNEWGRLYNDLTPIKPWHNASIYQPGAGDTSSAVANYECVLVPKVIEANGFSIRFTIGGTEYIWRRAQATTLTSGKQYTLNLTVGKDIIIPSELSAESWETGIGADLETE